VLPPGRGVRAGGSKWGVKRVVEVVNPEMLWYKCKNAIISKHVKL